MPERPIIPDIPTSLECIKLRDCYPYRRIFPALHHFTDRETGVLDYASLEAKQAFGAVSSELRKLGFHPQEIAVSAAAALIDVQNARQFFDYVQDPGDLFSHVQETC